MNAFLEAIFVNALWVTVLALFVAGVTGFVRRAPIVYALWTLVLLKLLIPPLFDIPLEVNGERFGFESNAPVADNREAAVDAGRVAISDLPTLPAGETAQSSEFSTADDYADLDAPSPDVTYPEMPVQAFVPPPEDLREPVFSSPSIAVTIALCWVCGSLLWLGNAARHVLSFRKLLKQTQPAPAALRARAIRLAERMGLPCCPELRIVEGRVPPLVWPARRGPIVLLPADLLANLDAAQQEMLIAHELAHVRRRDYWWRWLHLATLAVYWWHPVAWWSVRRIQQAEEQCCDAWVLWAIDDSGRHYAQTLLDTVDFLSPLSYSLPPQASGFGTHPPLKRRVEMLMQGRLTRRMSLGCRASMLIVGATILAVSVHARPAASAGGDASSNDSAIAAESAGTANADAADAVNKGSSATVEKDIEKVEKDVAKSDAAAPANAVAASATTDVSKRLDELEAKIRHLERKLTTPSGAMPQLGSPIGLSGHKIKPKQRQSTVAVRVKLNCPKGTNISMKGADGSEVTSGDISDPFIATLFVLKEGQPTDVQEFDFKLSNIPGHESTEFVAKLRLEPPCAMTIMYLLSNPVLLEITAEDIGQIDTEGSMFKVVYLDRAAQTAKSGDPLRTLSTTGKGGERSGKKGEERASEQTQILKEAHEHDVLAMLSIRRTAMTYVGGKEKMTDPPTAEEVTMALPDISQYELLDVRRKRSNIRITVKQTSNESGEPLFKCTAHYRETMSARWPVPYTHEEDKTDVVYLDRDHRVRADGAAGH